MALFGFIAGGWAAVFSGARIPRKDGTFFPKEDGLFGRLGRPFIFGIGLAVGSISAGSIF